MARIFEGARVTDSTLAETVTIGDRSIVTGSELLDAVRIQRDNYIQASRIGSFSYTGQSTRIFAARIGRFCSLSWNVSVGPSEHRMDSLTTHALNHDHSWGVFTEEALPVTKFAGETVIGHDVWIGCGAFVKKGVHVAEGCVIGANSVLGRDTEPYGIYAGSPARLIRFRHPPEIIAALAGLNLYDRPDDTVLAAMRHVAGRPLDMALIQELHRLL
ncbi:CatB-related O-acetyltransferase [Oceaniglobus trochenteri]|uniref:xenobiotic acyltransferase family protein n=1 Tax=Oceaniglobus trochenteri TaxID=2763260 RepID=UPI001CFFFCC8|nr:CatB-related O-acetyltransferase [Oceaniglobus trochenteri]